MSRKRSTSTTTRSSPPRRPQRALQPPPAKPARRFALALGSNLGDSRRIFEQALVRLEATLGPLDVAPLYRTEPVSAISQPPFLNTVVLGSTRLAAGELLELTQRVEADFGRERNAGELPEGPRTLDIDLLVLGDEQRSGEAPLLPHPRLRLRRFVLAPLCDLAPDWPLPPDGATARELLGRLPDSPWVERLAEPLRCVKVASQSDRSVR